MVRWINSGFGKPYGHRITRKKNELLPKMKQTKYIVTFEDLTVEAAWGIGSNEAKIKAQAKRIDEGKNYNVILIRKA
jgi:hypothetical protein